MNARRALRARFGPNAAVARAIERAVADDDGTDLYPLAGLDHLPAPQAVYTEAAWWLEVLETDLPPAEHADARH